MRQININKIVTKLKNEFNFGAIKGNFGRGVNKITYQSLEKLIFGNLTILGNDVKFLGENSKFFLDDYTWIYNSEADEIKKVKNRFIEEILKEIRFCPFCGKVPLIKFEKGRIFDLDHIFPKSRIKTSTIKVYPHLSINLYNLVPCCKGCNFIKSNKNFLNKKEIFHPYFGFIDSKGNIIKKLGTLDKRYSFTLLNKKRNLIFNSEHSHFFQLYKIYLNSQDTFNAFNFIQDKRTKIKAEKTKFKKITKTDDEWIEYFFKNYYPEKEEDILKYSNGKLKKDLIETLKL